MGNVLTQIQREFIVRKLAEFYSPREITSAFASAYPGVKCGENDVLNNDPRLIAVTPELHALFRTVRETVLEDENAAPYAKQLARLIVLSRDVEDCVARGDRLNARLALRQIAEEQGVVGGGKGAKVPDKAATVTTFRFETEEK